MRRRVPSGRGPAVTIQQLQFRQAQQETGKVHLLDRTTIGTQSARVAKSVR
jgi:hypothetical protein